MQGNRFAPLRAAVPGALSGRSVGRKLVCSTLDAVRATGLKVVPRRGFLAAYIERRSEHRDPLAHEG